MKRLSLLAFFLIPSITLNAMQDDKYFDSISEKNEYSMNTLQARHIPTKQIFVAFTYAHDKNNPRGYAFPEDNVNRGFDLDDKTSKIVFEAIKKVSEEADACKKRAVLAELHEAIAELDEKK